MDHHDTAMLHLYLTSAQTHYTDAWKTMGMAGLAALLTALFLIKPANIVGVLVCTFVLLGMLTWSLWEMREGRSDLDHIEALLSRRANEEEEVS